MSTYKRKLTKINFINIMLSKKQTGCKRLHVALHEVITLHKTK